MISERKPNVEQFNRSKVLKRLRRIIFNSLAATSMLLLITTCVFWVRSYRPPVPPQSLSEVWGLEHGHIGIVSGEVTIVHFNPDGAGDIFDNVRFQWRTFNFERYFGGSSGWSDNYQYTVIEFPFWALALTTVVVPVLFIFRRSKTQNRAGICGSCGYDLRATPDKCPECGTISPAQECSV